MEPPSQGSHKASVHVISQHGQIVAEQLQCARHCTWCWVGYKVCGPGPSLEGASVKTQRGPEITTMADAIFKEYEIETG